MHSIKTASSLVQKPLIKWLTPIALLAALLQTPLRAQTVNATSESGLTNAMIQANNLSSGSFLINVKTNITLTAPLPFIQLSAGVDLTIAGNGFTLDPTTNQGFVVVSGAVAITNLVISNALSYGGDGQDANMGFGTGEGGAEPAWAQRCSSGQTPPLSPVT